MVCDEAVTPLSRRARAIVWAAAILVALTRLLAVARTLWDWDEAQFALALRDYDVALHHPHPPGFPLFIAAARLVHFAVADEFRSLQVVTVIASLLVFPAMFALARRLGAPLFVAFASALLLAFSPNVWLFGGTALSDVPSMVLSVAACTLLLSGIASPASAPRVVGSLGAARVVAGAIVLAIAVGFRPQNLLIGAVPALLSLRRWKPALIGAAAALLICAASYGTAAKLSGGWSRYREAVTAHEQYIRTTDSFLSPIRPPLWRVADDFFFWPYRVPPLNVAIAVLALIAIARMRSHTRLALAIFGPFVVFAWLYLDYHSSSRFSIAYMPLFALLAADGLETLRRAKPFALAAIIVFTFVWMIPPLRVVRETMAPPVAAAEWIREHHRGPLRVDSRMTPFADLLLGDFPRGAGPVLREGRGKVTFIRERARLSRALTRPRYFEVAVDPSPAGN